MIAALTRGTVVVEAALRSGARNTAGHADRLSRAVMAVPGPVTSAMSAGCHELLRDEGAALVTDAADVSTRWVPSAATRSTARPGRGPGRTTAWTPMTLRVLEALPARRWAGAGQPSPGSPASTRPAVLRALGRLAAAGLARSRDGAAGADAGRRAAGAAWRRLARRAVRPVRRGGACLGARRGSR